MLNFEMFHTGDTAPVVRCENCQTVTLQADVARG